MITNELTKKEYIVKTPDEMIILGKKLGKELKANMILTLEGNLGAGKTTITKGIALGLEIDSIINSPTFTIMKIHQGRLTLYHMDVYRLDNNSGDDYLEEYFEANGVCVIEWAANISDLIPQDVLKVNIEYLENQEGRKVTFIATTKEYQEILERMDK